MKIKQFIENNAKIIEVTFSLISLLIVGVFGTTISINNSITSKSSLELSKAQAQPIFNVKIEDTTTDDSASEDLIISVDGGFAENVEVDEYVWIELKYENENELFNNEFVIPNFYFGTYFSGNNRGEIVRLDDNNNLGKYIVFYKNVLANYIGKIKSLKRSTLVVIKYKDISGNDYVKYYENGKSYFNHINNSDGEELVNKISKMTPIKIGELTVEAVGLK